MALDYSIRYRGERIHGMRAGDSIAGGTCDLEAGSIGTLTFQLPPTHPMARPEAFAIQDAGSEVTLLDGDEELFRGWVVKATLDSDLFLTVECESMLAYLKRTVVRPYSCRPATDLPDGTVMVAQDPFEWLVAQHNLHCGGSMQFSVGVNPHVGEVRAGTDWKSTWDELNDAFCTGLDRYLNARSGPNGIRYLDLLDGGSGEGTQVVVLGENVVDMEVAGESAEVVTAIIPRGTTEDEEAVAERDRIDHRSFGLDRTDGEIPLDNSLLVIEGDRALNQTLVDAYGIREEKREYEAATQAELLKMVAADLNPSNVPEGGLVTSVEARAIDLHTLNPRVQPMRLLEWTRVFIRAYGLEDEGKVHGISTGGRLVVDQWLPCSQIHIDLSDPGQSTYRFGDLPQTLTRQSALRMGMLRRGNGQLVRRTDSTEWNNDRTWNRTDDVWDHADEGDDELRQEIQDTADAWSAHLDEQFDTYTQQWYESLDEVAKEDAQGREDLLKHLDEVEGVWSDEIGRVDGAVSDLDDKVDRNHQELLDGIRDAALAAGRTFFGVCRTATGTRAKSLLSSEITTPGGESFELAKGAVIDILFENGEAMSGVTLDVGGTGPRTIRTNGESYAVWQDGEVVRFVYDGSYWQDCSNDIYGRTVTVGNPSGANFYTNGQVAELRIGSRAYWHAGVDGQTVGLVGQSHVDIGSDHVDVVGSSGHYLRMEHDDYGSSSVITCDDGLYLNNGVTDSNPAHASLLLPGSGWVSLHGQRVDIAASYYTMNGRPVVLRSVVLTANGSDTISVSASTFGTNVISGYAWSVANGDLNANDCFPIGCASTGNSTLTVKFDKDVYSGSRVRLNFLGLPIPDNAIGDEPGEGPEVFGDPVAPGPQLPSAGQEPNSEEAA